MNAFCIGFLSFPGSLLYPLTSFDKAVNLPIEAFQSNAVLEPATSGESPALVFYCRHNKLHR